MNFNVAYAGLCACILWYNIASANSMGAVQMDVAAWSRDKTNGCTTAPAQNIDANNPSGE